MADAPGPSGEQAPAAGNEAAAESTPAPTGTKEASGGQGSESATEGTGAAEASHSEVPEGNESSPEQSAERATTAIHADDEAQPSATDEGRTTVDAPSTEQDPDGATKTDAAEQDDAAGSDSATRSDSATTAGYDDEPLGPVGQELREAFSPPDPRPLRELGEQWQGTATAGEGAAEKAKRGEREVFATWGDDAGSALAERAVAVERENDGVFRGAKEMGRLAEVTAEDFHHTGEQMKGVTRGADRNAQLANALQPSEAETMVVTERLKAQAAGELTGLTTAAEDKLRRDWQALDFAGLVPGVGNAPDAARVEPAHAEQTPHIPPTPAPQRTLANTTHTGPTNPSLVNARSSAHEPPPQAPEPPPEDEGNWFTDLVEAGGDSLAEAGEWIQDAGETLGDALADLGATAREGIADGLGDAGEAIGGSVGEDIGETVGDAIGEEVEAVPKLGGAAVDGVLGALGNSVETTGSIIEEVGEGIRQGDPIEAVGEIGAEIGEGVAEGVGEIVDATNSLNDTVDGGGNDPIGGSVPEGVTFDRKRVNLGSDGQYYLWEGNTDVQIDEPGNLGRTITDIDRPQDGVLWEEKSAISAPDPQYWAEESVVKKMEAYLEARQYIAFHENAPVGMRFTTPGATPEFRTAVEDALADLRAKYPNETILVEWAE